jgi:hypothetical protein
LESRSPFFTGRNASRDSEYANAVSPDAAAAAAE